MTVHSPHVREWIDLLRNTTAQQVQDKLGGILYMGGEEGGEVKGFCCLGLGSTLAPGIEMREVDGRFEFNNSELLAPVEFIEWLYDRDNEWVHRVLADEQQTDEGWDVWVDWPEDMDQPRWPNWNISHKVTGAGMNDERFTFAQIADVFDYFGVKHDPARGEA